MDHGARDAAELREDTQWQQLLLTLADNLDQLVANFLIELGPVGEYGAGMVDPADVEKTAAVTLGMLTKRLAGLPLDSEHETAARDLGVRRAQQGVARDDLLDAVRLDFRVIWSTLTQIAGEGMEAVLVRNLNHVLATVDSYVSEVQQAYLTEQSVLTRDSRLHTSRFISRLFSSDPSRVGAIDEIARGLGVGLTAVFEVVYVGSDGAVVVQDALARGTLDAAWFVFDRGGGYVLFRVQPTPSSEDAVLNPIPSGVMTDVAGLVAVPAAASAAALLAQHSPTLGGRAVHWDEGWLAVTADLLGREVEGFGNAMWAALSECTENERDRILQTVIEYARTGSIKDTAGRLYCHRNTIVNRLRTFFELTGLDVTRPLDAASALVALARRPELFSMGYAGVTGL